MPGSYVRLLLEPKLATELEHCCLRLQEEVFPDRFYSQLDERDRAGLGRHPFHVTVRTSLHSSGLTQARVQQCLEVEGVMLRPPIIGRLWWHLAGRALQLRVEFTGDEFEALERRLGEQLLGTSPHGGSSHHITCGKFRRDGPIPGKAELARINARLPVAQGSQFMCDHIELENNDGRPCFPAVRLVALSPTAAAQHFIEEAHRLTDQLLDDTSVLMRVEVETNKHGRETFAKLVAEDPAALQALVRPIHNVLERAFKADPLAMLQKLGAECDAYNAGLCPKPRVWKSKLGNLHVSLSRKKRGQAGIDRVKREGGWCTVRFGSVPAEHNSDGHRGTRSALLCYKSSESNWITLHLRADALYQRGLEPGDDFYFHISLAKIEEPKHKKKKAAKKK